MSITSRAPTGSFHRTRAISFFAFYGKLKIRRREKNKSPNPNKRAISRSVLPNLFCIKRGIYIYTYYIGSLLLSAIYTQYIYNKTGVAVCILDFLQCRKPGLAFFNFFYLVSFFVEQNSFPVLLYAV